MGLFDVFKNKKDVFLSPTNGELLDLSVVPDEMFSQKMMGDGFAMKSSDGIIVSPIDGTVELIFDTKHAIGLKNNKGQEILIHLGVDTVNLKGEGFTVFVETGEKIKAGQKLIEMDVDFVKSNAKSDLSPVIFTNLGENECVSFSPGPVSQSENNRISIINK